jgi:hypothetical protein
MNQARLDVYCGKCDNIINREQIKEFLKEEEETDILKKFEELWVLERRFIIFFFYYQY